MWGKYYKLAIKLMCSMTKAEVVLEETEVYA